MLPSREGADGDGSRFGTCCFPVFDSRKAGTAGRGRKSLSPGLLPLMGFVREGGGAGCFKLEIGSFDCGTGCCIYLALPLTLEPVTDGWKRLILDSSHETEPVTPALF